MKKLLLTVILLSSVTLSSNAQDPRITDSLKNILRTNIDDSTRYKIYSWLAGTYLFSMPDSAVHYIELAKKTAVVQKNKWAQFQAKMYTALAYSLQRKDSVALRMALEGLREADSAQDPQYLKTAYAQLAAVSFHIKDFESSVKYNRKLFSLMDPKKDSVYLGIYYEHMGETFDEMNQIDSAELYITKAFQYFTSIGYVRDFSYYLMGNVYAKRNQLNLALQFYREAQLAKGSNGNKNRMDIEIGFARVFRKLNQIDSAIIHAKRAYNISKHISIPREKLESLSLLTELYKQQGNVDSPFVYLNNLSMLKDTLVNEERIKAIQNLSYTESIRQAKLEEQKASAEEERRANIQLAVTAIVILTLLILFLLLSRSIIVNHRFVEVLSVIALLVVFEFINLLIHPFLERITHHSPLLMLLALVAIAAVIVPLHHRLEHWATKKLVEKNKAIRLANAKKTIAELEADKV